MNDGNGQAAIETRGLSKFYGGRRGIESLDLAVKCGELFGFLGPNGAGKTTTIRLLLGLIHPTSGEARVLGHPIRGESLAIRGEIGNLPGEVALWDRFTGEQHLALVSGLRTRPPVLRRRLLDALALPPEALRRRVRGWSKGMKQKLAIVLALEHDPRLLILDEPTEGLDPLVRDVLFGILLDLRSRGTTVFMSSHNLGEVEKLCDRVAVVRDGRLVAVEDVAALRSSRVRRLTARFATDEMARRFAEGRGEVLSLRAGTVNLLLRGAIPETLSALSAAGVLDVEIGPPDLEEFFLTFYRGGS